MCGTSSDPEGVRQSAHCRVGVWEDSCTLNLKSHMVAFNDDGLCESFEEGVCEYYREGAIDKE